MKLISLFSGIGGFELAAEWMGWTPVVSCEINPFGKKVLEHYWPQAYHHTDIKTLTYEKINQELTKRFGAEWRSDDIILTGGFPCQPYSMAGKRLGKEDDRHLWPEMLRVIREVQPTWIVGENVFGLVNWNGGLVFHEVQTDLEAQGYEVQPYVLPACAVNAPHRRDRVWFVAYRDRKWSGQKHEFCTRGDLPEKWVDKCRIATNTDSCRYRGLAETSGNHNAESIRWMDKNCGQNRNEIRCEIDGCGWSSTHPNTNGLQQQRGHECCCKNDEGGISQSEWTTDTKNSNNGYPSKCSDGKSEISRGIIAKGYTEEGEFTNTRGICDMDKNCDKCQRPIIEDRDSINKSGTLVQKGQSRIQLPINPRMECDKTNTQPNAGNGQNDDNNDIKTMEGYAPHPNGNGLNGSDCEHEVNPSQGGEYALSNINKIPANWHNFPTQSPICGGDDGLPAELDGITFSKWRNESIKAYGNAIVPQVALQIFKAIQAYQQ